MTSTRVTVVWAAAALLGLAACNKLGFAGGAAGSEAGSAAADASHKLDTYVEANNAFIGTFGFEEKAAAYRKSDIAHASLVGENDIDVGPGSIDEGIAKLKAARAMTGGGAALDGAADPLIASMTKVQAHLASLEPYYRSKKYLDDKLARGRAEDPQMLAEIDAAEKDFMAFSKLLDVAIDQRDAVTLEKLKTADPIRYQLKLALMHGKKLVGLFDGVDDPKKPAILAAADAEVAIIEKAIADAHAEASRQGKSDPSALSTLTTMVGEYRTFKSGDDTYQLHYMLDKYNQAVEETNSDAGG